ncbi:peroxisome biogenesis factor 2-like isoform X2 [Prorops nasuta]|uniref:peroxisome biogenesis factor 2-like isoform X2 n=1 Tax=Prorops nasuta TaxID=863751 RepID=UPI0034CD3616
MLEASQIFATTDQQNLDGFPWRIKRKMSKTSYVSRINQIDAVQLDEEIFKVLKAQTKEVTKHFPLGKIDKWQSEIDALLRILIWSFSLRTGKSTFDDNRTVTSTELLEKVKLYFRWISMATSLLELINLLNFLHRGNQPQLIEKLLGISSQSTIPHKPRDIGYSYMARELLWHGLAELFTIGLPMINFHSLKQFMLSVFLSRRKSRVIKLFPLMELSTKCTYCNDNPILPTYAECGHIFCYYCLKANFIATSKFHCPICNLNLNSSNMKFYRANLNEAIVKDVSD